MSSIYFEKIKYTNANPEAPRLVLTKHRQELLTVTNIVLKKLFDFTNPYEDALSANPDKWVRYYTNITPMNELEYTIILTDVIGYYMGMCGTTIVLKSIDSKEYIFLISTENSLYSPALRKVHLGEKVAVYALKACDNIFVPAIVMRDFEEALFDDICNNNIFAKIMAARSFLNMYPERQVGIIKYLYSINGV